MKTNQKWFLVVVLVLMSVFPLVLLADSNDVFSLTNDPAGTNVGTNALATATPETFKPILDLLGGKGSWITTIIVWFAAISATLAPIAVWIRNKLADMLNARAASADEDDDQYLRALFGNPFYRFLAFVLNFANIRLPNLSELERAIAQQKEAARVAADKLLSSATAKV